MTPPVAQTARDRIVATMFDVVAESGLDRLSVREVASRAGVSIGAVQHHFSTKDDMLAAAFDELVGRTRGRIAGLRWGSDVRANVIAALSQLLPLDAERTAEAKVHLAFAARAAVNHDLAAMQAHTLRTVVNELSRGLSGVPDPSQTAALLLAAVDGVAMHAVSTDRARNRRSLQTAVEGLVDALLRG